MNCSNHLRSRVAPHRQLRSTSRLGLMLGTILLVPLAALLYPATAAAEKRSAREAKPMNVLFIAIDDLNDWTSFLGGYPNVNTPNLERLAREFRMQRIIFETARDVYDQMQRNWRGSKEVLLAKGRHHLDMPGIGQDLVSQKEHKVSAADHVS